MIDVRRISGEAVKPYLADLACLRIQVFREFPYLYEGDETYESDYLTSYADSARSVIVLARDGAQVIGVSTGLPLREADEAFRQPFVKAGIDVDRVFYLGESVLLPAYRGQGLGHRFFDEREAHASERGFALTAFCAVQRPSDHPLRPADYRPHDVFWTKRGYVKRPELQVTLPWNQVDGREVENVLTFWTRG